MDTITTKRTAEECVDDCDEDGQPNKRPKLTGARRKKLVKEEKKKHRGQNKNRRWNKLHDEQDLCWKLAIGGRCEFGPTESVKQWLPNALLTVLFMIGVDSIMTCLLILLPNRGIFIFLPLLIFAVNRPSSSSHRRTMAKTLKQGARYMRCAESVDTDFAAVFSTAMLSRQTMVPLV